MSIENPLWGAPRIHGELLKLGFEIAQSSVAKYMVKRGGPPSQGWRTFLRNHAPDIAAMDLFMAPRQQSRGPQHMLIAVILGLVTSQRHQPGLGLRRDRRFLAWSRSIIKGHQRAVGQRSLDAAFDGLVMDSKYSPHTAERRVFPVLQQHLRPRDSARRLRSRTRKRRQSTNLVVVQGQFDRSPPSRHDVAPRCAKRKRRIRQQTNRSMSAGFMES